MRKLKICAVCHKTIGDDISYIKAKEKTIYPDIDGNWWAMRKVYICNSCIRTIRETVKAEA